MNNITKKEATLFGQPLFFLEKGYPKNFSDSLFFR